MPKLRNSGTEIGMFAQWIARKCRNHNPLKELGMNREGTPDQYKTKASDGLSIMGDDESVIVYEAAGRTFTITVEEVTGSDVLQGRTRVKVGH